LTGDLQLLLIPLGNFKPVSDAALQFDFVLQRIGGLVVLGVVRIDKRPDRDLNIACIGMIRLAE